MNPLIQKIVERREAQVLDKLHRNVVGATVGIGSVDAESHLEALRFEQTLDDLGQVARLRELTANLPPPPGPYSAGGSFYRDLVAAGIDGDPLAMRRLGEQTKRAEALAGRELRMHPMGGHVPPGMEFSEVRASSSTSFGALVGDAFVPSAAGGLSGRTNRPLWDAIVADGGGFDLPPEGMEVTVVASSTASMTASSTSVENVAVNQTDIVGVDSQVPVRTVVASMILSRQALERGTVDSFINSELNKAVDAEMERVLVQQLLGSSLTFVASNTASQNSVGQCILQAARAASDIRGVPTRIIGWHSRRPLWMASQRASASTFDDVFYELGDADIFRYVQSNALLASTIGSQDKVITMNGTDVRLAAEPLRTFVDQSSQAGTLGVRIYGFRYAALSILYPSQVGCVSGAGLAAPAAFA